MTVGTAPAPVSGQSAGFPNYYNIPMTVGGGREGRLRGRPGMTV